MRAAFAILVAAAAMAVLLPRPVLAAFTHPSADAYWEYGEVN